MAGTPKEADDGIEAALADQVAWLRGLEQQQGRPLRVLFIGNVAGNAYLNAKFLRTYGIEAHVLSYDYYYPIGTPEWEDGIDRPRWFVQGPIRPCARYLHALLDGRTKTARLAWWLLRDAALVASAGEATLTRPRTTSVGSRTATATRAKVIDAFQRASARTHLAVIRVRYAQYRARLFVMYIASYAWYWLERVFLLRIKSVLRRAGLWKPHERRRPGQLAALPAPPLATEAVDAFGSLFPSRSDQLTLAEAEMWYRDADVWRALLARYDIVQGYGTDVIRAFVGAKRPYLGYEHGTLRDFTLGDDVVHRMTALGYRAADHVFITNGDCLEYARMLGISEYTPMIHPLDVARYQRPMQAEIDVLRRELRAEVVLLCPLRHDWAIKGTDVHLRALPAIRATNPSKTIAVVLTEWGAQVDDSRRLIDELGCDDLVRWTPPLGRDDLIVHMRAADVVLDQIALPHFGATAPQALAAGTPVIMSYDPASTDWIVGEPAPILAAFDPPGVAAAVTTALDSEWRVEFAAAAARWTRRWHHPDRIVLDHCSVYRRLLEPQSE